MNYHERFPKKRSWLCKTRCAFTGRSRPSIPCYGLPLSSLDGLLFLFVAKQFHVSQFTVPVCFVVRPTVCRSGVSSVWPRRIFFCTAEFCPGNDVHRFGQVSPVCDAVKCIRIFLRITFRHHSDH